MSFEETIKELTEFTSLSGHPDCPCLSPDYAPTTKVLLTDYSPWIKKKLVSHDLVAIQNFVWAIMRTVPPLGLSKDFIPMWEKHIRQNVDYLIHKNYEEYLLFPNSEAEIDLKAAVILGLFRGGYDGFTMNQETPNYIALMMLAHPMRFKNAETLLTRAKTFVHERIAFDRVMFKGDASRSFWIKFNLPDQNQLNESYAVDYQPTNNLQKLLQAIPLVSRIHLFDLSGITKDRCKSVFKPVTPTNIYHQVKYWGINLQESTETLLDAGLLIRPTSCETILASISKAELMKKLEACRVPYKESWNKNKIESVILSLDEQLRDEIVKDFSIVEFAPNLIEEFIAFEKLYNTLLPFFKLWLSFGIDLPRFGKTGPSKGLIRS